MAYRIWKRSKTQSSFDSYKSLRNQVKDMCRRGKSEYLNKQFSECSDNRQLWKRIRNLGITNKTDVTIPFSVSQLNSAFKVTPPITLPQEIRLFNEVRDVSLSRFAFSNVSNVDVVKAIFSIDSNAVGNDGIVLKFIKHIYPWIISHLTFLFNKILTSSTFPKLWKCAKIVPIPKCSEVRHIKDIRPISLLSGLSKVFERLMHSQINLYLEEFGLLSVSQSGFRQNHSTETALITVCDDISKMLDEKQIVVLVLLDFSKAFDAVDHRVMIDKLQKQFGFDSTALMLISSYLSGRSQFVSHGVQSSDSLPITCGVPQGSILGPLLFSLFINDLPMVLKYCSCQMYADDVQIYCGEKSFNAERLSEFINYDLDLIYLWSKQNKLNLNVEKTQSLLFSLSNPLRYMSLLPPIVLNSNVVQFSSVCKNLGMWMDGMMNWGSHIDSVCGKVYAGLRSLHVSASDASIVIRKKLVKSLLLPHFTYGSSILGRINQSNLGKLQKAYNACLRFVYKVNRFSSISSYSYDFLGCSLKTYYNYRLCVKIFKIIDNSAPQQLYNRFVRGNSSRMSQYRLPRNRTEVRNKSSLVHGISLYNSLPNNIKNLPFNKFKTETLAYLNNAE